MTGSGANRWEWVEQQLRAQLEIGSRERVLEIGSREQVLEMVSSFCELKPWPPVTTSSAR